MRHFEGLKINLTPNLHTTPESEALQVPSRHQLSSRAGEKILFLKYEEISLAPRQHKRDHNRGGLLRLHFHIKKIKAPQRFLQIVSRNLLSCNPFPLGRTGPEAASDFRDQIWPTVYRDGLQGGWGGCRTGNGKELSNSQACCLAQLCLAAA